MTYPWPAKESYQSKIVFSKDKGFPDVLHVWIWFLVSLALATPPGGHHLYCALLILPNFSCFASLLHVAFFCSLFSSCFEIMATAQHRVRRKPPPTIDISERYPSPDPSDPFAPLWALRNRTSSVQGQLPLASGQGLTTTSHHIPMERRRSNSYFSNSTATHAIPPRSSSAVPPPSGPREKFGYRPPSQAGFVTVSHASKRHAQDDTNTHVALSAFPIRKASSRNAHQESGVLSQPLAKHGRPNVERAQDSSSSIESESNSSVLPTHKSSGVKAKWMGEYESKNPGLATAISFNVGVDVKPTLVRRSTSNGTSNSVYVCLPAKSPQQQASPQQPQPQSRLAKFLSKKSSHEGGYMADGEKKSSRGNARPTHTGPVHKASISAPLTETFVHQGGQSKIESTKSTQDHDHTPAHVAGKVRNGYYTSDTDTEVILSICNCAKKSSYETNRNPRV